MESIIQGKFHITLLPKDLINVGRGVHSSLMIIARDSRLGLTTGWTNNNNITLI